MKTTRRLEFNARGYGKTSRLKEQLDQSPGHVVLVKDEPARTRMIKAGVRREQIKLFEEFSCTRFDLVNRADRSDSNT